MGLTGGGRPAAETPGGTAASRTQGKGRAGVNRVTSHLPDKEFLIASGQGCPTLI